MTADRAFDPAARAAPFSGARWLGVVLRRDALPQLAPTVLLHAGPPFEGDIPPAVRNACVQAILFEGLAPDAAGAQALLSERSVRLLPAQDHNVVTPLAQVVSASMPLAVVGDASHVAWAPLVEGTPPALRFGTDAPQALVRLRAVTDLGLHRLAPLLRAHPVALMPLIAQALADGDECHARTGAANAALVEALIGLSGDDSAALLASPGFVLPILMAAACWRLQQRPLQGVSAVGGNGLAFGLRLHGQAHWRCVPATPPVGTRLPGSEQVEALGAIGDSAVIDFCGLGGQSLDAAPALRQEWRDLLPAGLAQRREAVVDPSSGLVDPERIAASGQLPLVNLAILDRAAARGLLGRGWYAPDHALFAACFPT
jgi:hypothetical protein